jgi:hypothetical protein
MEIDVDGVADLLSAIYGRRAYLAALARAANLLKCGDQIGASRFVFVAARLVERAKTSPNFSDEEARVAEAIPVMVE